VLAHSSSLYPLGNCDWPGPETDPDYLTRLRAASYRPWPLSPYSRYWRRANAARGTGESCLPNANLAINAREGHAQPAWLVPFPSHLGLSSELTGNRLSALTGPSRFFQW